MPSAGRRVRRAHVNGEGNELGGQITGFGNVLRTGVEEVALLVIGEHGVEGAALGGVAGLWIDDLVEVGRRQPAVVGVGVGVNGQHELLFVVDALGDVGRLAHLLHRRQQQADQHGDDGDDHQQLDQREAGERRRVANGVPHGNSPFCRCRAKKVCFDPLAAASAVTDGLQPCLPDA